MRPHRRQPTRLPHPWDSPGKNTGVGCHFLLQCIKVKSEVAQSCPWTEAYQAPPSMGFSRQEYWSGVPLPSPNTLSRFVIAFLPRNKYLLISWLQLPSTVILEPKKIKSVTVSTFSWSICHEVMGPDAMILVFLNLEFQGSFFNLLLHAHLEAL